MKQTKANSPKVNKMRLARASQPNTFAIAFDAAEACEVFVAGDFNRWNPRSTPLRKDAQGVWRTELGVPPGGHEYRLIVDGQWQNDPRATGSIANPYGSNNSFVQVG